MIATQYVKGITVIPEEYDDYQIVNVLKWDKSIYAPLSPYAMRTDGNEIAKNSGGIIFENFYQGLKIYPRIYSNEVYPSVFQKGKKEYLSWKWETKNKYGDVVYDAANDKINYEAYYEWRDSIWQCNKPIRYPNGFHHRHTCAFALIIDDEGNERRMDYLTLRREIYIKEYQRLARKTNEYKSILKMLREGQNIMICEIDVPKNGKKGEFGKKVNEDNCYAISEKRLNKLFNDTSEAFGHGLALSAALLSDLKGYNVINFLALL
jgi:hypothetical protein